MLFTPLSCLREMNKICWEFLEKLRRTSQWRPFCRHQNMNTCRLYKIYILERAPHKEKPSTNVWSFSFLNHFREIINICWEFLEKWRPFVGIKTWTLLTYSEHTSSKNAQVQVEDLPSTVDNCEEIVNDPKDDDDEEEDIKWTISGKRPNLMLRACTRFWHTHLSIRLIMSINKSVSCLTYKMKRLSCVHGAHR